MKRTAASVSFLLFLLPFPAPCQTPPSLQPDLARAARIVEAIWEVMDGSGEEVWPAWDDYRDLSFFAAVPGVQDLLINPPARPEGAFSELSGHSLDVPVFVRRPSPEGRSWVGTFMYTVAGSPHRAVRLPAPTAEYSASFSDRVVERFNLSDADPPDPNLSSHDGLFLSLALHEAFHEWMMATHPGRMRMMNHDTPLEPHAVRDSLLVEEGRILAALLRESERDEVVRLGLGFLSLREERRRTLTEEDIEFERRWEVIEGLATYVETRAFQLFLDREDPDLAGELMELRRAQILGISRDNRSEDDARVRCYFFGMALGYALDRLRGDGWKEEIMREGVFLEDLLAREIGSEGIPAEL